MASILFKKALTEMFLYGNDWRLKKLESIRSDEQDGNQSYKDAEL